MERKRIQQVEKKAEAKALLEKELATIKVGGKQSTTKITRAEINAEKRIPNVMKTKEVEKPIEENLNRIVLEEDSAHGIDQALLLLRYLPTLNCKKKRSDEHYYNMLIFNF